MKIWKLFFEVDKFDNLMPEVPFSVEELHSFDGREQKEKWKPIKVKRMYPQKKLQLGDAPGFDFPVFSRRAVDVLRPLIQDSIEKLELISQDGEYYGINVITVLDVIDYQKSKYKTFSDGKRIMAFEKYCFKENNDIKRYNIFKIVDEPRRSAFVSDKFKQAVEQSGLLGFKFVLVWDSEKEVDSNQQTVIVANEKNYSYSCDVEENVMKEIISVAKGGLEYFNIEDTNDGEKLAGEVSKAIDEIYRTGRIPKQYECMDDAAIALGCLFGFSLVRALGWKWKAVGNSADDVVYCVVSSDENWVNPCMKYVQCLLANSHENEKENTCKLLFNLIKEKEQVIPKNRLTLIW